MNDKTVCNLMECWDFPGFPVFKIRASTAGGTGSVPGQRTKILHAAWYKKIKEYHEG